MHDDANARANARIGSVLDDKWTLERLLGVGGMAAVYAARHRNGARAAVKILHPELARVPELRDRFLREGYLANKVDHPGALKVLDDQVIKEGADAGLAYLVMELLEGESVDAKMQRLQSVLSEDDVLAVADDVLAPLAAAHDKGIVHRDIKPENLFIAKETDGDGKESTRVKILDFGLARMEVGVVTRAGLALGTPSFMAPEQAAGRSEEIDGRTDIFGVGATMFRCLTGARIHDGANGAEIVGKMATLPAPPVRSVRADLSEEVAAIIDRALQFKREDRYANAEAMRADVQMARAARVISLARAKIGNEPTLHDESPTAAVSASTSAALDPNAQPPSPSAFAAPPVQRSMSLPSTDPPHKWRAPIGFAVFWVVAVGAFATIFFVVRARLAAPTTVAAEGVPSSATSSSSSSGSTASTASTASIDDAAPSTVVSAAPSASASEAPEDLDEDAGILDAEADAGAKIAATPKPTTTKKPTVGKPPPKKKKKWK